MLRVMLKRYATGLRVLLPALAISATGGGLAAAGAIVMKDDTAGRPAHNRVLDGFPVLALIGTAVPFQVTPFSVMAKGEYTFVSTSLTAGYDNFLALYAAPFDPGNPVRNWLASNDDLNDGEFGQAGFDLELQAGLPYVAVTTGFSNGDFGAYSLSISGPGDVVVTAVPEPATWTAITAGLALAGAQRFRDRSRRGTRSRRGQR